MKRRIIYIIVVIQLIVIGYLIVTIVEKEESQQKVLMPHDKYMVNASPSGFLKFFFEPKPGVQEVRNNWLGKEYDYKIKHYINSDSLNQLGEVAEEKMPNTIRIAVLGASFTFGANVNTQDTYPSQLQSILNRECRGVNRFEVINLGVFGYDIQYAVERYRLRGVKYDPDIVIWYLTPDNFDLIKEMNGEEVTRIMDDEELLKIQGWHLRSLSNYFKKDLVFVSMPSLGWRYSRVIDSVKDDRPLTHIHKNSPDVLKSKDVFPDFHPTEKGYYKIAYDLYEYLKKQQLIKCK